MLVSVLVFARNCTYTYVIKARKIASRIVTCKYVQYVHLLQYTNKILTRYLQDTNKILANTYQIHTPKGMVSKSTYCFFDVHTASICTYHVSILYLFVVWLLNLLAYTYKIVYVCIDRVCCYTQVYVSILFRRFVNRMYLFVTVCIISICTYCMYMYVSVYIVCMCTY